MVNPSGICIPVVVAAVEEGLGIVLRTGIARFGTLFVLLVLGVQVVVGVDVVVLCAIVGVIDEAVRWGMVCMEEEALRSLSRRLWNRRRVRLLIRLFEHWQQQRISMRRNTRWRSFWIVTVNPWCGL